MRTYYVAQKEFSALATPAGVPIMIYRDPEELWLTAENYAQLEGNLAGVKTETPCFYATVKLNSFDIANKLQEELAQEQQLTPENRRLREKLIHVFTRATRNMLEALLRARGAVPADNL